MGTYLSSGARQLRLVGDPIDVVTGAVVERTRDALIPARVPLAWYRYYSSASGYNGPLGHAHRHAYECELRLDVDGLLYVAADGSVAGFPPSLTQRYFARTSGMIIRRLASGAFELERGRDTFVEFRALASPEVLRPVAYSWSGKRALRLEYDASDLLTAATDSEERRYRFAYDERRRLTAVVLADDPHRPTVLVKYDYDDGDHLVRVTDAYGGQTEHRWEGDRVIERVERSSYCVRYVFDAAGRCVRSEGQDGVQRVQLRYTPERRRTEVERADGGVWLYEYDAEGVVTAICDPSGVRRTYRYDDVGEPIEIEAGLERPFRGLPLGRSLQRAEDFWPSERHTPALLTLGLAPAWRPTNAIAFDYGRSAAYGYIRPAAAAAAAMHVARPLPKELREHVVGGAAVRGDPALQPRKGVPIVAGRFASTWDERDRAGTLIRRWDPSGVAESWSYDRAGNALVYHDRDGARWERQYGSWNHCVLTRDPLGAEARWHLAATEQLVSVDAPFADRTTFEYDRQDRLVGVSSTAAGQTVIQRDVFGREVSRTTAGGTVRIDRAENGRPSAVVLASGARLNLAFDDTGRITRASSASGEVTLEYASPKRLAADLRDGVGVRVSDADGCVQHEVLGRFHWRLSSVDDGEQVLQDPTGRQHRIARYPHGVFVRTFASGLRELSQFDWAGRCLTKARLPAGVRTANKRRYHWSPGGSLLKIDNGVRVLAEYQYDAALRIASVREANETVHRFEHDGAGNLVRQAALSGVRIGPGNRLEVAGARRFSFDDQGRVVRADGGDAAPEQFEYDELGRLTTIRRGALHWRAEYDAFGRRVRTWSDDRVTEYWWHGEQLVAERGPDGSVRLYVYADLDGLVPMLIVDYASDVDDAERGRVYALLTNQIGAPERVEDMDGATVWSATMSPFGATTVTENARIALPLRFPGHWHDEATGLHYNRHRYYSPALGRYLQPDPCGIAGGLNLYAYAGRPTSDVDVDGLACPFRTPDPDDEDAQAAREAREEAANLAGRLQREMDERGLHGSTTYAVLVVVDENGQRQLKVFVNSNQQEPHDWAQSIIDSHPGPPAAEFVPTKQPPPMLDRDGNPMRDDHGNPIRDPSTLTEGNDGRWRDSSGDAEQRGLRWADGQHDQDNVQQVEGVSATQGCCKGCTSAIENRQDGTTGITDAVVPPNSNTPFVQRGESDVQPGLPSPPING